MRLGFLRMRPQEIQNIYRKKAHHWAQILVWMPGVSAIFLSGSLAKETAQESSDIDFFIVTKPGKIFTARFFVAGVLKLFGVLADDAKNHAGKICPNHYITTDNLEILEKDRYAANLFAHNQFLAGNCQVWEDFVIKNSGWLKSFDKKFLNFFPTCETIPQKPYKSPYWFGRKIEHWCRDFQKKKLSKKTLPTTAKVWLTDTEIRLHAEPKNLSVIASDG